MIAERNGGVATPTEGVILPDADTGPTMETQPLPAELSGQVGELAAEVGVGSTGQEWRSKQFASLLHGKKVCRR